MKHPLVAMLVLGLLIPATLAEEKQETEDDVRKLGYSVGYQVGGDLARQDLTVNPEMIIRGLLDALAGSEPLMTEEEMKRALVKLEREATAAEQKLREGPAQRNLEQGAELLEEK